jgi:GTP-binding protein
VGPERTVDVNAADELRERGRLLFARPCRFVAGAARLEDLPPDDLPEVAFAGRSNVGKSSLLNALTGRRALARTSNTPGRTREVNFFELDGRLMLVDLPGYGYAKAPKQAIKRWSALARHYLRGRASLRRVCLLVDGRRGLGPGDLDLMADLDAAAVSYQIVLTKADKLKPGELAALREALGRRLAKHTAAHPEVVATSAVTGTGVAELRAALAELASAPAIE